MIKGIRRRQNSEKIYDLKRLIRDTADKIKRAQRDGDEKTEKKMKRHQYWRFRYAETLGMHKFEVKVVGKFEYTATVCAFGDSDAMEDTILEPSQLSPSLLIRETSVKRIKELDFKTNEVLRDEKIHS